MHRSPRNITDLAQFAARAGAVARAEVSLLGASRVLLGGKGVPVDSSLGSLREVSKVDQERGAQEKRHPRTSNRDPKKSSRGPREIPKSLQNVCKNLLQTGLQEPPTTTPQICPRNLQNRIASFPCIKALYQNCFIKALHHRLSPKPFTKALNQNPLLIPFIRTLYQNPLSKHLHDTCAAWSRSFLHILCTKPTNRCIETRYCNYMVNKILKQQAIQHVWPNSCFGLFPKVFEGHGSGMFWTGLGGWMERKSLPVLIKNIVEGAELWPLDSYWAGPRKICIVYSFQLKKCEL